MSPDRDVRHEVSEKFHPARCTIGDAMIREEMYDRFYVPHEETSSTLGNTMNAMVGKTSDALVAVAAAFYASLNAASSVASIPYQMLAKNYHDRKSQTTNLEGVEVTWTLGLYQRTMARFDMSDSLIFNFSSKTAFDTFKESAEELLRQCTVLCWSAFEVLSSDLFVALLNDNPSLADKIFSAPDTKDYFKPKELGAALPLHKYDLSHCMGEVLSDQLRVWDVLKIRNLFNALMPTNKALRGVLTHDLLWHLAQDRNLIVHRRAVVDAKYIENTGSKLPLGSTLFISAEQLNRYLAIVEDAGVELLKGAVDISQPPS
jgi:hypothetical protein